MKGNAYSPSTCDINLNSCLWPCDSEHALTCLISLSFLKAAKATWNGPSKRHHLCLCLRIYSVCIFLLILLLFLFPGYNCYAIPNTSHFWNTSQTDISNGWRLNVNVWIQSLTAAELDQTSWTNTALARLFIFFKWRGIMQLLNSVRINWIINQLQWNGLKWNIIWTCLWVKCLRFLCKLVLY